MVGTSTSSIVPSAATSWRRQVMADRSTHKLDGNAYKNKTEWQGDL
jgi:hypothetical protein